MKVRLTRQADMQLGAILAHVAARNAGAASRLSAAMEAAFDHIALHPGLGRAQTVQGVRRKVVQPSGYLIYDSADADERAVTVLAISHPAQQRPCRDS